MYVHTLLYVVYVLRVLHTEVYSGTCQARVLHALGFRVQGSGRKGWECGRTGAFGMRVQSDGE